MISKLSNPGISMNKYAICLLLTVSFSSYAQNSLPLDTMLGVSKAPSLQSCPQCSGALPPAVIKPAQSPFQFVAPEESALSSDVANRFDNIAKAISTLSLLVLKGDSVVFERYGNGVTKDNQLLSLSMSKSLISVMVGQAICDGKIAGVNDKAEKYAKDLTGTAYGNASIKSLLTMSSGADPGEGAFGEAVRGDAGRWAFGVISQTDTLKKFSGYKNGVFSKSKEGDWFYKNMDVFALSLVLQGAYEKDLPQITQEKLWNVIAAESQATWVIDKRQQPIVSSFFLATPRDWGRFARYLLNTLASETANSCMAGYLSDATRINQKTDGLLGFDGYGYLFWTDYRKDTSKKIFWIRGFAGQLIGIDAKTKTAMVLQSLDYSKFTEAANIYSDWVNTQ
jgi:CubicO group peptidase (beta-lactamase class C family)